MFSERKAAQIAAYLLEKMKDKETRRGKLVRLMYLADRQCYDSRGCSISDDDAMAMKNGPILLHTYNLVMGDKIPSNYWAELIAPRFQKEFTIGLTRDTSKSDTSELSTNDMEILDDVFKKYGHLHNWTELAPFTQTLPEWKKRWQECRPEYNAVRIDPKDILMALGKSGEMIKESLEKIEEKRKKAAAAAAAAKNLEKTEEKKKKATAAAVAVTAAAAAAAKSKNAASKN